MRPDDFFYDAIDDPLGFGGPARRFQGEMVDALRRGPLPEVPDVEAAVALTRLAHDELQAYGTSGGELLSDADMRQVLVALRAVTRRLGLDVSLPFRDFTTFRTFWIRNEASGSWQARRDMLSELLDPLHDELTDLETNALSSSLAGPVSPRGRTGWSTVDNEIAELRRHFSAASTPQDYRNVGNDCVIITEALSRTVYRADTHLRSGEEEPPVANTKQRLDRTMRRCASSLVRPSRWHRQSSIGARRRAAKRGWPLTP